MTTEFKVGDRVRRINDNFAGIKVGDIGTIEEIKSGWWGSTIVLKEYDFKNGFTYDNFELVEAAFVPTFREGDRVVGVQRGSGVKEGVEYTVERDSYLDAGEEVVNLAGILGYVFAFRVQHVKEETVSDLYDLDGNSITLDSYNPALLPLFAKAAEEAERRGYCAEYDGIAAVVGAPSREEIRHLTAPPVPVKTPKELAQEAFDAIPAGYTFHFTSQGEDFDRKHIKLSDSTYLHDFGGSWYNPTARNIEGFLGYGIEAN